MRQIIYVLQFIGQAAPEEGSATVLKATTTAPSSSVTTVIGPDGVRGALQRVAGEQATFESRVTFSSESAFQESGTISFGQHGQRLHFSTVGQGHLGASPDPGLKHGMVMWRVEGGEGQFAGAHSLITSNFLVGEAGEVTDNHFGVIFVE
jgi:hypothetical protein